jgi:hypothetical protein
VRGIFLSAQWMSPANMISYKSKRNKHIHLNRLKDAAERIDAVETKGYYELLFANTVPPLVPA